MANPNVMTFTDANFEAEVLQSQQPVLVDFWAEWCQPCRLLAPTIDDLATQFQGRAKVGKLDTDANRHIAMQFSINAIPTVLLFKGGKVARTFVGLQRKPDLVAALDQLV